MDWDKDRLHLVPTWGVRTAGTCVNTGWTILLISPPLTRTKSVLFTTYVLIIEWLN